MILVGELSIDKRYPRYYLSDMKRADREKHCVTIKSGGKTYIRGQWFMSWIAATPRVLKAGGTVEHDGRVWMWVGVG